MLKGAHPLEVILRLVFVAVGGLLTVAAVWMTIGNVCVIRSHDHATAEVVKCERIGPVAGKGLNHYYVQARYDGPDGPRTIELENSTTNYEVGEMVDIYYRPETAHKAIAGGFMQMWFYVIVVAVPGLVMLFFGLRPRTTNRMKVYSDIS